MFIFPALNRDQHYPVSSKSFISWNYPMTKATGLQLLSDLVKQGFVVTYS